MSTTALTKVGTKNAEQVVLLDAAGDQVTSFGGGTQYTEGDTDASITGTAIMWEDTSNTLTPVSSAKPLPVSVTGGGDATAANQTTIIGHVDGIETLLGTIDADTGAIATSVASIDTKTPALGQALAAASVPVVLTAAQVSTLTPPAAITGFALETTLGSVKTAVETLDNAISGNEMQVDVITMPTVQVQSNSANLATQTTAAAIQTSVELIDDTVATTASAIPTKGIAISGTDGTNARVLKTDTSGELQVDVITMPTVTVTATNLDVQSGGADLATSTQAGAIQTAVELIDDTVKVLGTDTYTEAATKGLVIGAVRRDADTTLVNTTNEIGPVQMNAAGQLKVEVFSGETLPVSLTSTTITGTVAVTQSGTWDEVGINDSGNSITVDNGGTFVTQENGAALTALQLLDDTIIADNAGFTDGTTKVNMSGYIYDEVAGTALTENDAAAARINANRAVVNAIEDGSTRGRYATVTASNALKVDNSGVTQPVSAASLPLPTGASTLAEQQTQTTALQLIDDGVATVASAITTKGMAAVGTDGTNARILKTDTSGELQVDVLTMPTVTVNSHAVTNAGTFAVQVDGSALTALQKIDDPVIVDDAAFTPATSSVMMAGFQADETATDSVDEGDAGAARMTLDRKLIVTVQPHTVGGWSTANMTTGDTFTALTNSAQAIKASAGSFGGYYYYNPNATATYINVYDVAAASVTVGTTTPKLTFCIPPTAAANIELVHGIPFGTAMSASATTTGGGSTAPSTALECMFYYK